MQHLYQTVGPPARENAQHHHGLQYTPSCMMTGEIRDG